MSVTKSFFGTIAAMLVAEGKLDANALVTQYVPELKDSAFGDATVRQVLDMTTGLQYSEAYADPKAEVWNYARAGNIMPRPPGYQGPAIVLRLPGDGAEGRRARPGLRLQDASTPMRWAG